MKLIRLIVISPFVALAFVAALVGTGAPAYAQAVRTWVSGTGDDANPCSRTAPCKTFAGAISKTAAGGEINCLDPGGFGAVTITKSMTIDCEDTQGSILAASTNGVNINASASGFPNSIRVILRGLSINGAGGGAQNASGSPGTGLVGVNFASGASVTIDRCIIQNFNAGNATGVRVSASGAITELHIANSVIANGGLMGTGGGVELVPGGGTTKAVINDSFISNSANNGIRLNAASGTVIATITNTVVSGHLNGIVLSANLAINLILKDSSVTNNSGAGISATGSGTLAFVGNTDIFGNTTGVSAAGRAALHSYGNNYLNANSATDGAFTGAIIPTK